MERLIGKRVLVTAAAHGIGRACAIRFVREGARVVAIDIDADALATLEGVDEAHRVDGTDPDAMAKLLGNGAAFGAVVHCIGMVDHGTVLDCDLPGWRRSFAVNVESFLHVLHAVLPAMVIAGGGSVVSIASVASSLKGLPKRAAYGASKAAVIGLTKSVAADFVAHGIRCNVVCPGTIVSPSLLGRVDDLGREVGGADKAMEMFVARQPIGRLGTAEEVAALCLYLASDESCFVTGQAFAIDGGITI